MRKFFSVLGLFIFSVIVTGCSFWWQNKSDVSGMVFYFYDQEKVNVELNVVPDYEKRTLTVNLMRYSKDTTTDDGVIGGSNFDDFEELLGAIDDLAPAELSAPMMSVVIERVGDGKVTYNWSDDLDEQGQKFYDFYTALSFLFSQDVY
ncbi:hypothetical protein HY604_00665 [Candidatus Peregrinibacteria bacterium]|nr:hypothetical protein [Candidatus Peregrinibacteria bacterium]